MNKKIPEIHFILDTLIGSNRRIIAFLESKICLHILEQLVKQPITYE